MNRINTGDITGAAALMSEDCLNHAAVPEAQGSKGFTKVMEKIRTAYPDMKYTIEDVVSEGDRAVLRVTFAGTNTGPLTFTHMPSKATGKPVKFEQIHIVRSASGKDRRALDGVRHRVDVPAARRADDASVVSMLGE